LIDVAYYTDVLSGRAPSDSLNIYIMFDGEDTTMTPPVTDAPVEETVVPQEEEVADEAADASETPAQA
jgi:hypothetical protein